MARRNERAVLKTLRDVFGIAGREADAVMDALIDEGFDPNRNTLGEHSAWVQSGRLFDVLDSVEAVQEEIERAEAGLPDVARERFVAARIASAGVIYDEELYDEPDMIYPGEEIEITFVYEEKK